MKFLLKNFGGKTLTAIAAKIYNTLLLNRVQAEIEKFLRKNQNGFHGNESTTSQILIISRITEGVRVKNLEATLLFVDFLLAYDFTQRKDRANTNSILSPDKKLFKLYWCFSKTSWQRFAHR